MTNTATRNTINPTKLRQAEKSHLTHFMYRRRVVSRLLGTTGEGVELFPISFVTIVPLSSKLRRTATRCHCTQRNWERSALCKMQAIKPNQFYTQPCASLWQQVLDGENGFLSCVMEYSTRCRGNVQSTLAPFVQNITFVHHWSPSWPLTRRRTFC